MVEISMFQLGMNLYKLWILPMTRVLMADYLARKKFGEMLLYFLYHIRVIFVCLIFFCN